MPKLEPIREKRLARQRLPEPALRRALRQHAHLSQEDVARAVGVHRETVSRWERGERTPSGERLIAYVAVLAELSEDVA